MKFNNKITLEEIKKLIGETVRLRTTNKLCKVDKIEIYKDKVIAILKFQNSNLTTRKKFEQFEIVKKPITKIKDDVIHKEDVVHKNINPEPNVDQHYFKNTAVDGITTFHWDTD